MATSDASDFLTGDFGRVRRGARADLLLLTRNPLEDLTTLRNPQAVIVRGEWIDRAALDVMLAKRKAASDK
jgi:imidazolonepropionase-like amidohydrolase